MSDWTEELQNAFYNGPHSHGSPVTLAQHIDAAYTRRPHIDYLNERVVQAVQDVLNGKSRFLMVSMPPRMGKSVLTSTYLPTWLLARNTSWKIGMMSHSPNFATSWGRSVRRIVEEHGELGVGIAKDAGAVSEWQTTESGGVVSRSVPGQSITGLGFKVMIMDDVVKDFASAHSLADRDAVWNWWTANSRTRLEPPSLAIVIGTRWHEDDFLGRLLSPEYDGDPDEWEVIKFPAIAEENDVLGRKVGEPLLSPLISESREEALERWATIKRAVGSYAWAALYQQRPAPAEGAIFNTSWWQYWEHESELPLFSKIITSWDCAFKDTKGSDYVVGQRWGVYGPDRYLLDQVRGRWSFTETLDQMRKFNKLSGHEHFVEDKANGPAVIDTLKQEISGVIPVNPTNSKEARARAVTPQVESGNVYLPRKAWWLNELLMELQSFPTGMHDDQVDALTQALSRLQGVAGPPRVMEHSGVLLSW